MREPLQIWFDKWRAEHADFPAYLRVSEQIKFIRDELSALVWAGVPFTGDPWCALDLCDRGITPHVIGEIPKSSSLSVRLPICLFERADLGIQLVMRWYGGGWLLSVMSEHPVESDLLPCLFHTTPPIEPEYTGNELAPVCFEGFPRDRIFGYHCENPRRWSACLPSQQVLWTVIFLCMRSVGAILPQAWATRK